MFDNPQLILDIVIAAAAFSLVFALWLMIVLIWTRQRTARKQRIQARLRGEASEDNSKRELTLWHEGERQTTFVPLGVGGTWMENLETDIEQAGFDLRGLGAMLIGVIVLGGVLLSVLLFSGNLPLAIGTAVAAVIMLRMYVRFRAAKRRQAFEQQLVEALELAARSLRAGHPLMGAFQLVHEEMAEPIASVFGDICQQHAMGAGVEEVLRTAAERSSSADMKLFATSVSIQLRSGGNLANLMQRLAWVIRDRLRLSRRVRILTAQTQMSKRVLIVLPFLLFLVLSAINPDYMTPFYATLAGRIMLGAGLGLLALGAWVINLMANLEY